MTHPISHPDPLVYLAPATLHAVRETLAQQLADTEDITLTLRDAGYAGGDAIYGAFQAFATQHGATQPHDLPVVDFFALAGDFFTEAGWGDVSFAEHDDSFCIISIENCWERTDTPPAGCHLTVGALSAFLEKFADYPISILELGPPHNDTGHDAAATGNGCRFLAGNMEMIGDYYSRSLQR